MADLTDSPSDHHACRTTVMANPSLHLPEGLPSTQADHYHVRYGATRSQPVLVPSPPDPLECLPRLQVA